MFHVYILYSKKLDRYYVGSTCDLDRRLQDHNRGKTAYARQGMPWELKYQEAFESRSAATRREREIKARKIREYIERLISAGTEHPA